MHAGQALNTAVQALGHMQYRPYVQWGRHCIQCRICIQHMIPCNAPCVQRTDTWSALVYLDTMLLLVLIYFNAVRSSHIRCQKMHLQKVRWKWIAVALFSFFFCIMFVFFFFLLFSSSFVVVSFSSFLFLLLFSLSLLFVFSFLLLLLFVCLLFSSFLFLLFFVCFCFLLSVWVLNLSYI